MGDAEAESGTSESAESLLPSVAESASRSNCAVRSPGSSATPCSPLGSGCDEGAESELASSTNGSLLRPLPFPFPLPPAPVSADVGKMSFRFLAGSGGGVPSCTASPSAGRGCCGGSNAASERSSAAYTALSWSMSVARLRDTLKPYRLTSACSASVGHSSKYGVGKEALELEAHLETHLGLGTLDALSRPERLDMSARWRKRSGVGCSHVACAGWMSASACGRLVERARSVSGRMKGGRALRWPSGGIWSEFRGFGLAGSIGCRIFLDLLPPLLPLAAWIRSSVSKMSSHLAPSTNGKSSALSTSPSHSQAPSSSSQSHSHSHSHSHHHHTPHAIPTAALVEPPALFASVAPQIYRSATPAAANHSFVRTLKLRTILSLTAELPSPSLTAFCKKHGIRLLHFGLRRWGSQDISARDKHLAAEDNGEETGLDLSFLHSFKAPSAPSLAQYETASPTITEELVKDSLQILLTASYHPILVTDTSGIHEIGVLLGCLRKLQRWNFATILLEYRHFAGNRARATNERFVEMFDTDLITFPDQDQLPYWFREQIQADDDELDRIDPCS
ncbi:hypothetical protein L1887_55767 [Cichorium endivia]|nr:hypothetical protein L1887_55767 [Cichorium endivia]